MDEREWQTWQAAWQDWHAEHEHRRAGPHGFLAVTSLRFLDGTPRRFDDAPGAWSTGGSGTGESGTGESGILVELAAGESLVVDGKKRTGRHDFGVLDQQGVIATFGDAVVEVARRGRFAMVRPRHPGHPLRTRYRGTPTYAPDEKWVLTGHYVPFDEARDVVVGSVVDGIEHVYASPGRVEFSVGGVPLALTAFTGDEPGSLSVVFTDETSGVTTYAANRRLGIAAPAADGTVVLDFNRATNLPCAYTDFATCPLPPAGNRLPVAVEAGEKIPYERAGTTAGLPRSAGSPGWS
jgi:uncharacterized protein (DUF1684 family)